MSKRILRPTISQADTEVPLKAQPSRDHAAMILPTSAIKLGANVRTDLGDLEELIASVKEHGILQPIILAKVAGGLELVAGYRRLEAAKRAGLAEIPARIVNATEDQIAVLRMVENLIRENLTGLEEVRAVAALAPIFNGNQVELARTLGKSKSYVSKCIKAAAAIKELKVSDPKLSLSMLFELAYAHDPEAASKAVTSGQVTSSKAVRKPSGAIAGGRYGAQGCLAFNERNGGKAFSLRLNVDYERTPPESREQIIKTLETILRRLKGV